MSRPLLVLRPEPGACATARRAKALGHDAVISPLFTLQALDWDPPSSGRFDALMLTSANAVRLGGPALATYAHLPLYAVGGATAEAARAAGFTAIHAGAAGAEALLAQAAADGRTRLLHLVGREHRAVVTEGVTIERRIVYAAGAVDRLPDGAREALARGAVALLHSPRAASLFAALADREGLARASIPVAAISEAARQAAGEGWRAAVVAAAPNDDALLAAAARLCD